MNARPKPLLTLLFACGLMLAGNLSAQTWLPTGSPNNLWYALVSSADGARLVGLATPVGQVNISTNGGNTWTANKFLGNNATSFATSADGNVLLGQSFNSGFVPGTNFYVLNFISTYSTNGGFTWTNFGQQATSLSSPSIIACAVACSTDGHVLLFAYSASSRNSSGPTGINLSTDYGATWSVLYTAPFNTSFSFQSATMAALGQKFALPTGDQLITSTNGGSNLVFHAATTSPAIASTPDGSSLYLGSYADGLIHVSHDWGSSWTACGTPSNYWTSLAVSADGSQLLAANHDTNVFYYSTDSGATWAPQNIVSNAIWASLAISADGRKLYAATQNGLIYYATVNRGPTLHLSPSGTNALLSWTIPSTNVLLLENSTLDNSNWQSLPNTPTLDLNTLQNSIARPLTNGNHFYWLKTQ